MMCTCRLRMVVGPKMARPNKNERVDQYITEVDSDTQYAIPIKKQLENTLFYKNLMNEE